MAHGKLHQAQERHYKDPALIRSSRSIAFTDAEWETVNKAVEISGVGKGQFMVARAQEYLLMHEMRKAEREPVNV